MQPNWVYYCSNGFCWDGKACKYNEGDGYQEGQTVTITLNVNLGIIAWSVGDAPPRYKLKMPLLANNSIKWVPFINLF